jgi:5'-nucleotidase (lipoprotein e(P4) family)
MSRRRASTLLIVALGLGCAGGARPAAAPAPATWPDDLKWVRTSAEYPALTLEVYRTATARVLEAARGRPTGSWAVILDADETILDNSEHERRTAAAGLGFSDRSWVPWVRERAAPAVPGAVAFIAAVQAAGGRIAVVTNRADSLCADTRANLESVGVRPDLLLCKPGGGSDNNPRFEVVRTGAPPSGLGPVTVVAWVGDNIQDFPGMSQAARRTPGALEPFGSRWFILPNPLYGSWQANPES